MHSDYAYALKCLDITSNFTFRTVNDMHKKVQVDSR